MLGFWGPLPPREAFFYQEDNISKTLRHSFCFGGYDEQYGNKFTSLSRNKPIAQSLSSLLNKCIDILSYTSTHTPHLDSDILNIHINNNHNNIHNCELYTQLLFPYSPSKSQLWKTTDRARSCTTTFTRDIHRIITTITFHCYHFYHIRKLR